MKMPICLEHLKQKAETYFCTLNAQELRFENFIGICTPKADEELQKCGFWKAEGEKRFLV